MSFALSKDDVRRLRNDHDSSARFRDARMLFATYRTAPEVVAKIIPKPLRPSPQSLAMAFIADYPRTDFGGAYQEGALFVQAALRRELGWYCLSMPVTDDMALIYGREFYGFPKKIAEHIELTQHDSRVEGSVVRKGVEILRIECDLADDVSLDAWSSLGQLAAEPATDPTCAATLFLFKAFPSPDGRKFDYLPRLIRQVTHFRPQAAVRGGHGRVVVQSSPWDTLAEVPVVGDPLMLAYGTFDNTMLPGRVVRRVWNPWGFLPHFFLRSDIAAVKLGWAQRDATPE